MIDLLTLKIAMSPSTQRGVRARHAMQALNDKEHRRYNFCLQQVVNTVQTPIS